MNKLRYIYIVIILLFASFLAACNRIDASEFGISLPQVLHAQNVDEFAESAFLTFLNDMNPNYREDSDMRETVLDEIRMLASLPGELHESYLEDFDFLVDLMGRQGDEFWELVRTKTDDFFHLNDPTFTILLNIAFEYAFGEFCCMPFVPIPYEMFVAIQQDGVFEHYIVSPNRIVVAIFDLSE